MKMTYTQSRPCHSAWRHRAERLCICWALHTANITVLRGISRLYCWHGFGAAKPGDMSYEFYAGLPERAAVPRCESTASQHQSP